jgi:hypothetical protein
VWKTQSFFSAANSANQLLWLLGVRSTTSLLIWSDEEDDVVDWRSVIALRQFATNNQLVYDLLPAHRLQLQSLPLVPIPVKIRLHQMGDFCSTKTLTEIDGMQLNLLVHLKCCRPLWSAISVSHFSDGPQRFSSQN